MRLEHESLLQCIQSDCFYRQLKIDIFNARRIFGGQIRLCRFSVAVSLARGTQIIASIVSKKKFKRSRFENRYEYIKLAASISGLARRNRRQQ